MSDLDTAPVVLVGPADYARLCPTGRGMLLDAGCRLIENPYDRPYTRAELLALVPDVTAGIVGVEPWDAELLDAAPELRVLSKMGVGLDNVDTLAARQRGVHVTNVPGGNANAVAELAVGLMLSVLRRIPRMDVAARAGDWTRNVGIELSGKTVGIAGFGAIGRTLARRLRGFDVRALAWDPYADAEQARALGVELVDLDRLLGEADLVSLHVPSLPETHHLIDAAALAKMKPTAYLVNTARGALVDESALLDALRAGRLAGAGLDVFETEPLPAGSALAELANVVLTSHGAADSVEAYEHIGVITAQAVLDAIADREPQNLANRRAA